jgi:hypothetical protein
MAQNGYVLFLRPPEILAAGFLHPVTALDTATIPPPGIAAAVFLRQLTTANLG